MTWSRRPRSGMYYHPPKNRTEWRQWPAIYFTEVFPYLRWPLNQ